MSSSLETSDMQSKGCQSCNSNNLSVFLEVQHNSIFNFCCFVRCPSILCSYKNHVLVREIRVGGRVSIVPQEPLCKHIFMKNITRINKKMKLENLKKGNEKL